jgi:outer membrane protein OmpA-like peptidoglycan-associated protein
MRWLASQARDRGLAFNQTEVGAHGGSSEGTPVALVTFPERVFFDFDKSDIRPDGVPVIDLMAENMKRDVPGVKLLILGHTDARGDDDYNYRLSRERAETVMRALASRGVPLGQMYTVPVGKTQPAYPNDTEENRARNRRVEFVISSSEAANEEVISDRKVSCQNLAMTRKEGCLHRTPRVLPVQQLQSKEDGTIVLAEVSQVQLRTPSPPPAVRVPCQDALAECTAEPADGLK